MNYRLIFCLLLIVAMVGVVSADTLIVYTTGTEDGYTDRGTAGGNTFTDRRNGAGTYVSTSAVTNVMRLTAHGTTSNYYTYLYRGNLQFNTSTIPDDSTVNSAIVGLFGHTSTVSTLGITNVGLTGFTPATPGALVQEDYQTFGSTLYSDSYITNTSWTTSGYNNWTLNADGLAAINKTGYTPIATRLKWDITNDTTGLTWVASGDSALYYQNQEHGSTGKPFLQIEYTAGGATAPVASFTLNKNFLRTPNSVTATDTSTNTPTPTSWNWSWGDGTANSTTQNATHTYTKRGKFDIILSVADSNGGSNTSAPTSVKVVGYENY